MLTVTPIWTMLDRPDLYDYLHFANRIWLLRFTSICLPSSRLSRFFRGRPRPRFNSGKASIIDGPAFCEDVDAADIGRSVPSTSTKSLSGELARLEIYKFYEVNKLRVRKEICGPPATYISIKIVRILIIVHPCVIFVAYSLLNGCNIRFQFCAVLFELKIFIQCKSCLYYLSFIAKNYIFKRVLGDFNHQSSLLCKIWLVAVVLFAIVGNQLNVGNEFSSWVILVRWERTLLTWIKKILWQITLNFLWNRF